MKFNLSERQEKILTMIGMGTVLLTALIAPNMAGALYKISKQIEFISKLKSKNKYHTKRAIDNLIRKDIIYLSGDEVKLTKRGKELLKIIQLKDLEIIRPKKWDQVWHLVSYDIPEFKKKERDWFRVKLVGLGFAQIQDSLWAYPFECREEIAVITQTLGISPYVAYLNTDKLPRQDRLERRFGLKD